MLAKVEGMSGIFYCLDGATIPGHMAAIRCIGQHYMWRKSSTATGLKGVSYERPNVNFKPLDRYWQSFFVERGISQATALRNRLAQDAGNGALAFPYFREGELINVKFRQRMEKRFWQAAGTEKVPSHHTQIV